LLQDAAEKRLEWSFEKLFYYYYFLVATFLNKKMKF
jgi:hypothetical protein